VLIKRWYGASRAWLIRKIGIDESSSSWVWRIRKSARNGSCSREITDTDEVFSDRFKRTANVCV
jgi:hypothetical protein